MESLLNIIVPISSFLACVLVAYFLSKTSFFAFLDTREKRFASLDGIRGFLALSVFFHHFVFTYYWKINGTWRRPPEDMYQNFGKVGVAIFFMITGFLFITKITQKNKKINWIQLYQSRFFRIMPLYLFALSVISFIVFSSANYQLNVPALTLIRQYIDWGIFMGGQINDFPNTILIIAGVDWTLKYEWLFYFSLPLIAFFINKFNLLGVVAVVLLSVLLFFKPITLFSFSSKFMIFFCVGGLASYIVRYYQEIKAIKGIWYSTINLLLIITAIFYPATFDFFHVCIIALFFILTLLGNDLYGVFSTRASAILGEISYSIYLLHGLVLYVLFTFLNAIELSEYRFDEFLYFMPLIAVVVVLISSITFLCIEKPCMDSGRKLLIRFNLFEIHKR